MRTSRDRWGMSAARLVAIVLAVLLIALPPAVSGSDPVPEVKDSPPVANAGPDQTVNEDTAVVFDGSRSTDDIGIVNYTWAIPSPPGPVRDLFTLPYSSGLAVFDPARPYLYAVDGHRVDVVNVTSGSRGLSYIWAHQEIHPLSLGVSPKGTYLVLGIPTGPRGTYEFGPYSSYFMSVDLVNQSVLGEFFVDEDILHVLPMSDGHVIVAGGSGQWAAERVLDVRNGSEWPQRGQVREDDDLALHPSETRTYSNSWDLSPRWVWRSDITSGVGIVRYMQPWPYSGDYDPGRKIWASPRGDLLLTGSGLVLSSNDNVSLDMVYQTDLVTGAITAAAFSSDQYVIAVVEGTLLEFFDMDTYESLGSRDLGDVPVALTIRGNDAVALAGNRVVAVRLPRTFMYGVSPAHFFSEPGTYIVSLVVRDTAGNTSRDTVRITVNDITSPVASAGPDRTVIHGTGVSFDGYASWDNVGITSYLWTFTDGAPQSASGVRFSHQFNSLGTYVITLTVTDAAGNRGNDTTTVSVVRDSTAPVAVAGPDRTIYAGGSVTFDGTSSTDNIGIESFFWMFDDGSPRTLAGPTAVYRFATPGLYSVTLIVTDPDGNVAEDMFTVRVLDISLVTYTHPSRTFRVGLPDGWDTQTDFRVGSIPADVAALGPFSDGPRFTLVVTSQPARAEKTDEYLLSAARDMIAEISLRQPGTIVVREPTMIAAKTSHAAAFEVALPDPSVHQIWAVFASKDRQRIWAVGAVIGRSSVDGNRSLVEAVIASFEVLPLELFENPIGVFGVVTGIVTAVFIALFAVGWRRLKKKGALTIPTSASSAVSPAKATAPATEPRVAASASTGPPPLAIGWAIERPRFCMDCGTGLEGSDHFCPACGKRVTWAP